MRYIETAIPSATAAAQDFPTQKHFVMATAPIILAAGLAILAPDWPSEPLPRAFPAQNAETTTPISASPSIPRTVRAFGQACNTAKFETFADDQKCLGAASATALELARDFYARLTGGAGLDIATVLPDTLAKAWEKKLASNDDHLSESAAADIRTIRNYATRCHHFMADNIQNPSASLAFSHTTGYGVARYCIESALRVAGRTGVTIDVRAASQMLDALDDIYAHYDTHPIGEGRPALQGDLGVGSPF